MFKHYVYEGHDPVVVYGAFSERHAAAVANDQGYDVTGRGRLVN